MIGSRRPEGHGRRTPLLSRLPGLLLTLAAAAGASPARAESSLPFGLIISEQSRTSFTLVGAGARAAGMGGAFTAVADDASAASFNPAGLAQLLVPEFSAVFDYSRVEDTYANFHSYDQSQVLPLTDSSVQFSHSGFNFASLTLPFRLFDRRFAFQLSSQKVVDFTYHGTRQFSETSPSGTPIYGLEQTSNQSGAIYTYSASLAAQPTERMLLGVTVNRWDGAWTFASTNSEWALPSGGDRETFTYSQTNSLKGWNADFGILLRYPYFNVGLRYRTPFDATYGYSANLATNVPTPLEPLPQAETTLHWPGTFNVGFALKPADTLLIAADWGRTDWSRMSFDVPGTGHVNFFDLLPPERTLTRQTDDWRVGAEFLLFFGRTLVPLRAGWFREPQPSVDAITGEQVVATGWSFGTGLKRDWLSFDASVRYTSSHAQVSRFLEAGSIASGNLTASSRGELDRHSVSVLVSLLLQIPSGSGPERVLEEIFVGPSKPQK